MLTDVLAIVLLFILRLGVPLLVVFGISYVLYRWLGQEQVSVQPVAGQPRATVGGPAPVARVVYAATPCWEAHKCSQQLRLSCPAYRRPELPCWLAVQLAEGHLRRGCSDCSFYARLATA